MQEYVVLDIFCFCCTMLPTREVKKDHVRHSVHLDPSYLCAIQNCNFAGFPGFKAGNFVKSILVPYDLFIKIKKRDPLKTGIPKRNISLLESQKMIPFF